MINSEYGIDFNPEEGSKIKNDQSAADFMSLPEMVRIFKRSHIYAGSSDRTPRKMGVYDSQQKKMVQKMITIPRCLERCFLEIFSNATDNVKRSRSQNINPGIIRIVMDGDTISIESEGLPIPLEPHNELCVGNNFGTVVDLIFGIVGAGSNLNDSFSRETGGQNGLGAKIVNILSRQFTVEAGDNIRGVHQIASWSRNMCQKDASVCTPPYEFEHGAWKLSGVPYTGRNFVKITWKQDFRKFSCNSYSEEDYELYLKYMIDASFFNKIKINFNDQELDYRNIDSYVNVISPEASKSKVTFYSWKTVPTCEKKDIPKLVALGELFPEVEMCILDTPENGFHISYANGIFNGLGGVHTNEAYRATLSLIKEILVTDKTFGMTTADTDKLDIKILKKHATVIINYKCSNPGFTNQEKEQLTKPTPKINLAVDDLKNLKKWKVLEKI